MKINAIEIKPGMIIEHKNDLVIKYLDKKEIVNVEQKDK